MALLADTVKTNLIHYNQWTTVTDLHISTDKGPLVLLRGKPPVVLPSTEEIGLEWVVPILMLAKKTSAAEIELWFQGIALESGNRPKRITMAMVNDDGTVVYYFVHDGVVKPRQN